MTSLADIKFKIKKTYDDFTNDRGVVGAIRDGAKELGKGTWEFGTALGQTAASFWNAQRQAKEVDRAIAESNKTLQAAKLARESGNNQAAAQLTRNQGTRLADLSARIQKDAFSQPTEKEMTQRLVSGGLRTGLTIAGATAPGTSKLAVLGKKIAIPHVLTNAAVGGGLNVAMGDKSKSAWERFGEGAGSSVKYSGINRITGPVIDKATQTAGLIPRIITKAGANLAEDMSYARLAENRNLTPSEAVLSVALPTVTEVGGEAVKKIRLSRELDNSRLSTDGYVRNRAGQLYNPETHRYVPESSPEALKAKSAQEKYIKLVGGGQIGEKQIGKIKLKKTGPNNWVDTRYTDEFKSDVETPKMEVVDRNAEKIKLTEGGKIRLKNSTEIRKIENNIAKGEMAIRQGGWGSNKFSPEELDMVRRGINDNRAKIGMDPLPIKSAAGQLPANSPELRQRAAGLQQDHEQAQVEADQAGVIRSMFSQDQIKDINKLKFLGSRILANGGDVESLRAKYPALVEGVTSHVREAESSIVDDGEALKYALDLPTKAATLAAKPEELDAVIKSLEPINKLKEAGVEVKTGDAGKISVANAEPTVETSQKIVERARVADEKAAKSDYVQWQRAVYGQEKAKGGISNAVKLMTDSIKENTTSPLATPEDIKDISNLSSGFRDVYRNFQAAYGPKFEDAKKLLLDPFDKAKGAMVDEQKQWIDELDGHIIKELGIKPGSMESEAVQLFGEGKMTQMDLVKELGEEKAQHIMEADKWFRAAYDKLLSDINRGRAMIYPNNPDKIIPRRADYYRHFTELTNHPTMQGLKNIFDTPANISSTLAGVSDFTKPKTKWLSLAQKRKGDLTTIDAVTGFLDYLKAATYAKHIDPHAAAFRNLAEDLGKTSENMAYSMPDTSGKPLSIGDMVRSGDRGNVGKITQLNNDGTASIFFKNNTEGTSATVNEPLEDLQRLIPSGSEPPNNFIEFLHDFANDLDGKTNPADRAFQKYIPGGRKTFKVINWLNSRVKANVILGNLSSSIAQFFNVPQGIADAGIQNSTKGAGKSLASIFIENKPMSESSFIKERYADDLYSRFDKGIINDGRKLAIWITQVGDEVGTKFIWNSEYERAIADGIESPVKFADDRTRAMVAGRGIGEVPLLQKAKLTQVFAPFQLEVVNLWHVMGEFVGEKQFGKLAKLFIASYLMNQGAKAIRGSDVTFDPINAMVEAFGAYQNEDDKKIGALKAGGRLAGEVLSNVMGGQYAATMYPKYGFKVGDAKMPTREELFGEGDPTRFGGGPLFSEGLKDPLYKLLPPYGGQQIKRTIEGLKTVGRGYAEESGGKYQTPVDQTFLNYARSFAYGKNSLPEMQAYYDEKREPLGDSQTSFVKQSANPKEAYGKIVEFRKNDTKDDKIRAQVKKEGSGQTTDSKVFWYDEDSGQTNTINYGKYVATPPTNAMEKIKWENDRFDTAMKIYRSEGVDDKAKEEIYKKLNVSGLDLGYYDAASNSDPRIHRLYVDQYVKANPTKAAIESLVDLRKEVNGSKILSDNMIDGYIDDGKLSKAEGKYLKNIVWDDVAGSLKQKKKSGKKVSIKSIRITPTQVSTPARMSTPQIKFNTGSRIKLMEPGQSSTKRMIKLKKLPTSKLKIKSTYYQGAKK